MKKNLVYLLLILALAACRQPVSPRLEQDFNFNWKFSLKNEVGSALRSFDDSNWEAVNLPHDWSIELPFDSLQGEGCTGYTTGGIGWYRREFCVDDAKNKAVYILFDGIYNHSAIFLNGQKLTSHVSGYTPFYIDISDKIRSGVVNTISIKVDRSRYADSRWYSGSGIYRNVKMIVTDKLHVPVWGTFVSTPSVSESEATVHIETEISNKYNKDKSYRLLTQIFDPNGNIVGKANTNDICLAAGKQSVKQSLCIKSPVLWGVEKPVLYKAVCQIIEEEVVVDQTTTTFGIRDIHFDVEKGFYLNGENLKIKGLCIHADAGAVGVAVPKEVWRRRLKKLVDGGCNALRMAHHPASTELLDLCDEMGILVQDEFFDEWNYPKDKRLNCHERHDDYISRGYADWFEDNAEQDLKNTILSHRNHPSIIQWSIGNEIEWTYPRNKNATGFFDSMNWDGDYFWSPPPHSPQRIKEEYEKQPALEYNIGETAKMLAAMTREMDTTRPVTANCILPSASFETGYADALDIVGFSYRRVMYDYARENYPGHTVMGTENLPQWHEWKAVEERDFISGLFLWTGIDYMGEANNMWPQRGLTCGLLDIAGFEKPAYHMYKTLWTERPHLYLGTKPLAHSSYKLDKKGHLVEKKPDGWKHKLWAWPNYNEHWNYKQGEEVVVIVLSNTESVELFLDNKSLGVKYLKDFQDHIYKWIVPYSEGTLKAIGDGVDVELKTNTSPQFMDLIADKKALVADGYDVLHLELLLKDKAGTPVRNDDREVRFSIEGDAKIIGIDNGNLSHTYFYKGNVIRTHRGKALLMVQSKRGGKGEIKITASSEGMDDVEVTYNLVR